MQIAYSTNFVAVFLPLTNLHNSFLWPRHFLAKCKASFLLKRPDDLQNQTGDTLACPLARFHSTLPLSFWFKNISCSQSTSLFHSDAEEAASSASLWVLHNDDFECGMLNCFHAAFQNARESVPVQAQTKDVDHTVTGVVKSPLFTSSRKQPATRPAELRCQEKSAGRRSEQLSYSETVLWC